MNIQKKLSQISLDVKKQYEIFPYPSYPLLAKPRWQDGYLGSSLFSARLAEGLGHRGHPLLTAENHSIVLLGGGEIQPYVLRKLEPKEHSMTTIDLSRQSIKRAQIRLLSCLKPMNFIEGDINHFLESSKPSSVAHIDAYGVLHHLEDPSTTLDLMSRILAPRGTSRVMVYNSVARHWIFQLQQIFKLLKLSPYEKSDLDFARKLLFKLETHIPFLKEKLRCLGKETLKNNARFVDTFFHSREVRLDIERWFSLFKEKGLKPFALYDRYAEMDDLKNPLWSVPNIDELCLRAKNFTFENNIEVFLVKEDEHKVHQKTHKDYKIFWELSLKNPPTSWFKFQETKAIPWFLRKILWHRYLSFVFTSTPTYIDELTFKIIPLEAWKRLARLGVILPGMVKYQGLKDEFRKPIEEGIIEKNDGKNDGIISNTLILKIKNDLLKTLERKQINTPRRLNILLKRLELLEKSTL